MHRKILAGLSVAALAIAAPSQAQSGSPEDSTIKDTANKVTEPFDGKEAPAKLVAIQGDPYSLAGMRKCAAIQQEIVELDEVLGPDVNETEEQSTAKK
ncbi:MAG: hypothetical protein KKB78_12945, partial [Alphaproteobacteria bacterium]|nr:hypothetical protein [Alphaproteobacteria bacterium]